ncbi:hypothetical protein D1007_01377 [Hordeum vulgare]|nr:hypothetical protein D1007_01377 [Hordeum vulgare]
MPNAAAQPLGPNLEFDLNLVGQRLIERLAKEEAAINEEKLSQAKVVVKVESKQDNLGINWSQLMNRTHPITEVRRHHRLASDEANHLDAYSEYRSEQVIDRQDTHEDIVSFVLLKECPCNMQIFDGTLTLSGAAKLVVAIQICSHREVYEPLIPGLRGNYNLEDWCLQRVTPARQLTDHVMMEALARALEVPLRVERVRGGYDPDIYTGPGVPRPRVTLLYSANHYEIIYPRAPSDESSSHQASQREDLADESSSQQTSQREDPADESSSHQASQREDPSAESSSHQASQREDPADESPSHQAPQREDPADES